MARFRRVRWNGLLGGALALVFLAAAALGPGLFPYHLHELRMDQRLVPPGAAGHLLGTDEFGRDLLAAILSGARISLWVGTVIVTAGLALGTAVGLAAGYASTTS